MLNIKFIKENPEIIKEALRKRNFKFNSDESSDGNQVNLPKLMNEFSGISALIDGLISLDSSRLKVRQLFEEKKAELNKVNKEIGIKKSKKEDTSDLMWEAREVKNRMEMLDDGGDSQKRIDNLLKFLPNLPHSSVPVGKDETDNIEQRHWGKVRDLNFDIKSHEKLGAALGILDFERSAKISGSRFVVLWGAAARLERALASFMLDIQTKENGYKEVYPPYLVNAASAFGTGQLPKFEEDLYKTKLDDLYLISTAEIPVTNLHAGEILTGDELPIKYCAYTTCFRREAGSYGKDTKGMLRVHQFNKVELVKFVKPEESYNELEKLLSDAEKILQLLELPYRVVTLCSGDLGFSAAKTYDLEVWLPSQNNYREISSCSNYEGFQARRAKIRFKRDNKSKPEFIHTLNGSGLAIGRTMIAIMENYQNADGSITIPKVLRKYLDGLEKIEKSD